MKLKSFVPFASCVLLALALAGCSPSNNDNNAASDNSSSDANSAQSSNEAVDNSAAENSAVTSSTAEPSTPQGPALIANIWVPGKDDKLHSRPVSKAAIDAQKKFGDPTPALAEIIKLSPQYFPPKTQVLDFHDDGKTVSINLNRNFADAAFWSKAGDTTLRLALYALINSASNASGTGKSVVLQTEKRPVGTIGELDMEGPIEPDLTLQAKVGSSSAGKSGGSKTGGA